MRLILKEIRLKMTLNKIILLYKNLKFILYVGVIQFSTIFGIT